MFPRALLFLLLLQAAALAQWVADSRTGDIVHFLRSDKIERYDLAARAWLPGVTLPRGGATSFHHDSSSAFVAFGKAIYRYGTDFSGEQFLLNATVGGNHVVGLARDGNVLVLVGGNHYTAETQTVRLDTLAVIATQSNVGNAYHAVFDLAARRVAVLGEDRVRFASWRGPEEAVPGSFIYLPSDIYYTLFPSTRNLWISPSGARMVCPAGNAVTLPDRKFISKLPAQVHAADFDGELAVIATSASIVRLDSNYQPAGTLLVPSGIRTLRVHQGHAFAFRAADSFSPIQVSIHELAPIVDPVPAAGPATIGNNNPPETVLVDRDGVLLMHRAGSSMISRWSPATTSFLPGIQLRNSANRFVYCPDTHRIFTIYPGGVIRVVAAIPASPELGFATVPYEPRSLCICDTRVLAVVFSERYLFESDGVPVSMATHGDYHFEPEWDPVRKRLYGGGLQMETLATVTPIGTFINTINGPDQTTYGSSGKVRISPDGEWIFSGNRIFSADGLGEAALIGRKSFDYAWEAGSTWMINPTHFVDAIWDGGTRLLTIENQGDGNTLVSEWTGTGFRKGPATGTVLGSPVSIKRIAGGFLVLTRISSELHFTRLKQDLSLDGTQPPIPPAPVPAPALTVGTRRATSIDLSWTVAGPVKSFRLRYATQLDPPPAEPGYGTDISVGLGGAARSLTVPNLQVNKSHRFRLEALDAAQQVLWERIVYANTLPHLNYPSGSPYNLRIVTIGSDRVTLQWDDNALNETGFMVTRTNPDATKTSVSFPAGATSGTLTGLTPSTAYSFRVQAFNGTVVGDLSNSVSLTTTQTGELPDYLSVSTISVLGGGVSMTFTNPRNEDGFIIERSLDVEPRQWSEVARLPRNTTTYRDLSAAPGPRYAYRINAYNAHGTRSSDTFEVVLTDPAGTYVGISRAEANKRFFSMRHPSRIEPYNFVTRTWETSIPTAEPPRSITADSASLFALEGITLTGFAPDGSARRELHTASERADTLFIIDDKVISRGSLPAGAYTGFITNPKDGSAAPEKLPVTQQGNGYDSMPYFQRPAARKDGSRRVFGQFGPAIGVLDFPPGGGSGLLKTASYWGGYSPLIFVSSDESWIITHEGIRYSKDLVYSGQPLEEFDDLVFHPGGILIARRGKRLDSHGPGFELRSSLDLTETPVAMDIRGEELFLFYSAPGEERGMRVETMALQSLSGIETALSESQVVTSEWNLLTRTLTLTNTGSAPVEAFLISVSGLPQGMRLVNGIAAGDGSYSLRVPANLAVDASMTVILQFIGGAVGPFEPVISVLPMHANQAAAPVTQSILPGADFGFRFPATPGARYRIEYSTNLKHWISSPIVLRAAGNVLEWEDKGPPWTEEGDAASRFYRAVEQP